MTRLLRFYEFVPNSDGKRRRSFPMVLAKQPCTCVQLYSCTVFNICPRNDNEVEWSCRGGESRLSSTDGDETATPQEEARRLRRAGNRLPVANLSLNPTILVDLLWQ